jgi:hypothetical protein
VSYGLQEMAGDAHSMRRTKSGLGLFSAVMLMLPQMSMAATITIYDADFDGRVFVDVVGAINPDDPDAFAKKTANIFTIPSAKAPSTRYLRR